MIRIYLKMKEQYIKTEMEYTFNFWMMLISGVVTRLVAMAVPFVILNHDVAHSILVFRLTRKVA